MTFGIDISTHQAGLDIASAKAAGAEFVIVKSVASYRPELTVADDYQSGTDRVIAAGLGHAKGHYAVPNSKNTPAVTARFQMSVVYRRAPSDVFMLDNEPLDGYKVFWRDDDAAAYFYTLHELGVPYSQMWLYCPAALTRASGPWPKIEALRKLGLRIVWVSYGDLDAVREPGEEPLLGGGITGWDVHQFTSAWRVPGYGGNVDGNYSPHPLAELFGGGGVMEDQMRQYIAANPKPADAATWDQKCGSLMFRFNTWRGWASVPTRDISSAYRTATNSGPLNTDASKAPVGAWHFFDIAGAANGHVMQDARGGGTFCLSTGYALSVSLGSAIGFQSVAGYVAARGARYMGWSTNYAGGTISVSGLAGDGITPIEEDDMFTDEDRNNLAEIRALAGTGAGYFLNRSPQEVVQAERSHQIGEIYRMVVQLVTGASAPANVPAENNLWSLLRSLDSGGVDVDELAAKTAERVVAALPAGVDAPSVADIVSGIKSQWAK